MDYLEELKTAILNLHGCTAEHIQTVPVHEVFQGQTAWKGNVEVFAIDHPKTSRCYAWAHETDNGKRYVAVLEISPVDSPENAVKAAIMDEIRNARKS